MRKATLLLNNISLKPSQIHKFRGFIGRLFQDHDLIHNHDPKTGKVIYRYPLIQFKLIQRTPAIIAVTDRAVKLFSEIFLTLDSIRIDDVRIPVYEKDLQVEEVEFGYAEETFMYEFISPWIGLNQKNYGRYVKSPNAEGKNRILKGALIGNLLSMSKYFDHWLSRDQEIKSEIRVKEQQVNLKGKPMIGFSGVFKTNFLIPDHLGIGKSVSRGFGAVERVL